MTTPNPYDILPALQSIAAGHPVGSGARDTLERAVAELVALRNTTTAAQARCSDLVKENRDLRAQLAGHPVVRVRRVGSPDLPLPRYETEGAAGMDLRADVANMTRLGFHMVRCPPRGDEPWLLSLQPGARANIPCGFALEIPAGFEGQVRGRSSWKLRGLDALLGTIDPDYRGPVCVTVHNHSSEVIDIRQGDRIAQLVVAPAPQARLEEADELSPTARGAGGHGSTGVR